MLILLVLCFLFKRCIKKFFSSTCTKCRIFVQVRCFFPLEIGEVKLNIDGSSRGNLGIGGSGVVFTDSSNIFIGCVMM